MKTLKKIYDVFTDIEKYFIFVLFFFATVMVVINVLGRKIFAFSFPWLEELNRYILVITTFIGASIGITLNKHARMDSIVGLFKGRSNLIVEALGHLIHAALLAVATYYGWVQLDKMIMLNATTATLVVPVWVFFLFIPLGFTGMTIRTLIQVGQFIVGAVKYKKPSEEEIAMEGAEDQ